MNNTRHALPISPLLPDWLAEEPPATFDVVLLRTSGPDLDGAIGGASGVLADRPIVQRLATIGGAEAILHDQTLCREFGIQQIERRHGSPHATEPSKAMGRLWVDRFSRGILVLAYDSIGTDNTVEPSDPSMPRNAMNELVIQLAALLPVRDVHVVSWDRLVRLRDHGARLASALQRLAVDVYEGDRLVDLTNAMRRQ